MFPKKKLSLDKGLLLEDLNELLPWNADMEALRRIGSPELVESGDKVRLCWKGRTFLSGLEGVICSQEWDRRNPRKRLRMITLRGFMGQSDPLESFRLHLAHLAPLLGHPFEVCPQPGRSCWPADEYPSCTWPLGQITVDLAVFDRFGSYMQLQVHCKGYNFGKG